MNQYHKVINPNHPTALVTLGHDRQNTPQFLITLLLSVRFRIYKYDIARRTEDHAMCAPSTVESPNLLPLRETIALPNAEDTA